MTACRPVRAGVLAGPLLLVACTAALWRPTHVDSPPTGSATSPARPASLPPPAVVWPDGPPDGGAFADDERVRAFRDADLAYNAHDYSDTNLAELVSQGDIEVDVNRQRGFADGEWRYGSTHAFLYLPGARPARTGRHPPARGPRAR